MFLLHGKVHVTRQLHGGGQRLDAAQVALDDETLVHPHQLGNPVIDEQVVADGNLTCVASALDEQIAQLGRVQHDVAVVGDKGVRHFLVQVLGAACGQRRGGFGHQTFNKGLHHLHLELVLALDVQQHFLQVGVLVVGQCHGHDLLETRLLHQNRHRRLEILVRQRTDVLILHWNGYVFVLYHSGLY